MLNSTTTYVISLCVFSLIGAIGRSQVVQFRLETTDVSGTPVDAVTLGEDFYLKAYTQHMNGYMDEDNSGVFAGYLDVAYDGSLASVAGEIEHSGDYANGKSGDISAPGHFDNIGGFSSGGELGIGLEPLGLSEYLLFSVPMRADRVGQLSFVGQESGSYPAHDVLVYGLDEPVPAKDVDFGEVGARVDFGAVNINIVPEPSVGVLLLGAAFSILATRRKIRF